MANWFKRLGRKFFGGGRLSPDEFRDFVLEVMARRFPSRNIAPTADSSLVLSGELQLGLHNLYAVYRQSDATPAELETMVFDHFQRMFAQLEGRDLDLDRRWDQVERQLRPQLMPAEFAEEGPIVHFPFLEGEVSIGVVVDTPDAYAYVREEDAIAWGRTPEELMEVAVANLSRASKGISLAVSQGAMAFIAVEEKDGYDAARLLVPSVRRLAAEELGSPFYAAIPNRDFLIMWSVQNSSEFLNFARDKVAADFAEQPYPLTPRILRISHTRIDVDDE